MIKKSLLAGAILALPALALAPRGTMPQSGPFYVPVAHAADEVPAPKGLEPAELGGLAWAVLEQHCVSCHGEGKGKYRASPIDKTTLPKLLEKGQIKPGKPDESELYTLMINHDEPMPPAKVTVRPSAADVKLIKLWIEKGAPTWVVEEKPAAAK